VELACSPNLIKSSAAMALRIVSLEFVDFVTASVGTFSLIMVAVRTDFENCLTLVTFR
jgi:hypothetical protein